MRATARGLPLSALAGSVLAVAPKGRMPAVKVTREKAVCLPVSWIARTGAPSQMRKRGDAY